MTEEQIEMLRKALELYGFTLTDLPTADEYDQNNANEFFKMKEKLSDLLGIDLT